MDRWTDSQKDIDEAKTIADRGNMGQYQIECHLSYTRLYLAQSKRDKAREHWATAKAMVERMGYHRRDGEVEEIEQALG